MRKHKYREVVIEDYHHIIKFSVSLIFVIYSLFAGDFIPVYICLLTLKKLLFYLEIVTGALLGLSTLLFVGPVFFYLIKSTLEHSVAAGLGVAIGIIIGDCIYAILVLKGMGSFFSNQENQKWLAIAGGVLLVGMGIKYLLKPVVVVDFSKKNSKKSIWMYGINGFLINFINPFVIGVWIVFLGINQSKFDSSSDVITAMISTLIVIFTTDLLKVFFAAKLKPLIKPKNFKIVLQLFGAIMLIFGIRLFFSIF